MTHARVCRILLQVRTMSVVLLHSVKKAWEVARMFGIPHLSRLIGSLNADVKTNPTCQ